MMKRQSTTNLFLWGGLLLSLMITGCDRNDYKTRIQEENDAANPTGNKTVCFRVGKVFPEMYPYTIKYMEGYHKDLYYRDPIYVNHELNERLALFAKEGLFSEELVGQDGDKPLYRYDLTEEGKKYVDWWGGTNFCFGRLVVDSIDRVTDDRNGIGGGKMRTVTFYFHLENIPKWIQNKDIYSMYPGYGGIETAVTGQKVRGGSHYYSVSSDGKLRLLRGKSGGYIL
jgi:hypothetical protein